MAGYGVAIKNSFLNLVPPRWTGWRFKSPPHPIHTRWQPYFTTTNERLQFQESIVDYHYFGLFHSYRTWDYEGIFDTWTKWTFYITFHVRGLYNRVQLGRRWNIQIRQGFVCWTAVCWTVLHCNTVFSE